MPTYAELRLRIDRGVARGSYRIVATGPAGEALGRFKLPFSDLELENFILKVGSTRRGRRRIDSPEMELAKTFGTKLFGALFEGDVRELYRSSFAETRGAGQGLRVTLSLTGAPELLQVPWEYMYDHPSFLSISTWTPIVRYLDLPKPRRPLQIELPLRILAMVSAPVDFEVIDAAQERTKLETALAPLVGMGAISIDWLEEASLRGLQRQLRKGDYHVFHYIGHGGYDQEADDGVLMFTDEDGRGRRVSGVQLGTILADEVSLRLAVLNSCEGGRSSVQDPFSGVATSLIEREIPAVIGMQFEITDRAAIVFAGEFYSALADGLPVDSSVAEARKAIYADQNDIEWGTPVLFMRVADGRLFDVQDHAPLRTPQAEAANAAAAEEAAQVDAARVEAARVEAARVEAAEHERAAEAERAEAERADADRVAAAEAERVEAEREEAARAEAVRLQTEAERVEGERLAREAADQARAAEEARLEREAVAQAAPVAPSPAQHPVLAASPTADLVAATVTGIPESRAPLAPEAETAVPAAASVSPGLVMAAGRAALGSFLGLVMIWLFVFQTQHSRFEGGSFDAYFGFFLNETGLTMIAIVAAVTLAEGLFPSLRVPNGSVYRWVGGNRSGAAAIQGAFAGATVGFAVTNWYYIAVQSQNRPLTFEDALIHSVFTGLGFVIAEYVLGRQRSASVHGTEVVVADRTRVASPGVSSIPRFLPRAAGRAALGAVMTAAGVCAWQYLVSPNDFGADFPRLFQQTAEVAIGMILIVVVGEGLLPAVRVPGGSGYRLVRANRWAASAIQGAFAGAAAGFVVVVLLYPSVLTQGDFLLLVTTLALLTAPSFVVAEAVIDRLLKRRPGELGRQ